MSQESQPLTFGVEFEVALAYADPTKVQPDYSDTRTVAFDTIEADFWAPYEIGNPLVCKNSIFAATRNAAFRHIQSTMESAGYAVHRDGGFNEWSLTLDLSVIKPSELPHYLDYLDLEFVSPAYYFVPDALKAIEDVLALLKSTYLMNVNVTTGFHVHCGDNLNGFKFDTLRKLTSFLFAFTPQLNTIHPFSRQDVTKASYANSLRENSRFEIKRRLTHKTRPTPIQTISRFMNSRTSMELLRHAGNPDAPKEMAYNLASIQAMTSGDQDKYFKPTIEFRQHEGCLDAVEAINWIKTVLGIVDFCMNAPTAAVDRMLQITKFETWEKLGDGHDAEREAQLGPILADKDFTAIHLLQALKLPGPALHYAQRGLYKHEMKHRIDSTSTDSTELETSKWDYEKRPPRDPAVLARQVKLRDAWDALQAASKARELLDPPVRARWTFDPTDSLWPSHDTTLDDGADTDATTDEESSNLSGSSLGSTVSLSTDSSDSWEPITDPSHPLYMNQFGTPTSSISRFEGSTGRISNSLAAPLSPSSGSSSGEIDALEDETADKGMAENDRQWGEKLGGSGGVGDLFE
ncbi:hypothetical protein LSUB1_G005009, partial [Lachnellula subtilissima]